MQQQHQVPGTGQRIRSTVSWLLFICRALAVSVEVFLHRSRSFGARYVGTQAAVAAVIIFCFPAFFERHDPRPMMWFLAAFLWMCLMARAGTVARQRGGEPEEHSYYTGRPRLMRVFRRIPEVNLKSVTEPFLVFVAGLVAHEMNEPLGTYLMFAAVALLVSVKLSVRYERVRALDMNDSLLEQRRVTDQWRDMRGE